jgi:two-component system sensor histidine kinase KdpD
VRRSPIPDLLSSDAPARRVVIAVAAILGSFLLATVAIAIVEAPPLSIGNAASLYLVAVVVSAVFGPLPAILAAFAAFVAYDLLFIHPRFTLAVEDAREWLDLLLFLVVGLAIARLAGAQSQRAAEAERRLREANALFAVSRTLVTTDTTAAGLPAILDLLLAETGGTRIRITRGDADGLVAERGSGPIGAGPIVTTLVRKPGAEPAQWVRAHQPNRPRRESGDGGTFRVAISADGDAVGALWLVRPRSSGQPGGEETRLLALAADQIGVAWQRERFGAEAKEADVARRSEAAQTALLESVSHDLRTPLASIRASAGGLADPAVDWPDAERRVVATRIDAEAARLDRLVANLLDLSRLEGGNLAPRLEPYDLAHLLDAALGRVAEALPSERVSMRIPDDLPPVLVDPVLIDQALANVLENAIHHAPGSRVTIDAAVDASVGQVTLRIEDNGPGVAPAVLGRMFERFYRGPVVERGARRGLGIGLAVVQRAVGAMGGSVHAEPGSEGGLAIVLQLPAATAPEHDV